MMRQARMRNCFIYQAETEALSNCLAKAALKNKEIKLIEIESQNSKEEAVEVKNMPGDELNQMEVLMSDDDEAAGVSEEEKQHLISAKVSEVKEEVKYQRSKKKRRTNLIDFAESWFIDKSSTMVASRKKKGKSGKPAWTIRTQCKRLVEQADDAICLAQMRILIARGLTKRVKLPPSEFNDTKIPRAVELFI